MNGYATRFNRLNFRLKKPLQQLLSRDVVATMRIRYYPPFTRVLVNGKYRAEVVDAVPASPGNIAKLYTMSGFDTPRSGWRPPGGSTGAGSPDGYS